MKSEFIIILFVLCFTNVCCEKNIKEIDITQFVWEINSVKTDHTIHRVENQYSFNSESYKLFFQQDGNFQLNTSVNLAIGNFVIEQRGIIHFYGYQEITEVGGGNDIDKELLKLIPQVSSYKVKSQRLHLYGDSFEIVLKKFS
jgi:hypothetical protein